MVLKRRIARKGQYVQFPQNLSGVARRREGLGTLSPIGLVGRRYGYDLEAVDAREIVRGAEGTVYLTPCGVSQSAILRAWCT